MPWLSEKTAHDDEVLLETQRVVLPDIEARSYFVAGYGLSAACARTLEGWLRGYRLGGTGIPEYMLEAPAAHALELVRENLGKGDRAPELITIRAGGPLQTRRLTDGFHRGILRLHSAVASRVAELCWDLAARLPCPLVFCIRDGTNVFKSDPDLDPAYPKNVVVATAHRFLESTMNRQMGLQTRYANRIPVTIGEIKMRFDARFVQDELKVLRLLAGHSSVSGGVFGVVGINRAAAREALEELRYRRGLQATFRSIICAARFKFFRQGPFYRLCAPAAET